MPSKQFRLFTLFFTTILSSILVIDMLSGINSSTEIVKHKKIQNGYNSSEYGIYTNKGEYPTSKKLVLAISKGDSVKIFKTNLLGELSHIEWSERTIKNEFYSIYNHLRLFPIVAIISTMLSIMFRARNEKVCDTFLLISTLLLIYLFIAIVSNNTI